MGLIRITKPFLCLYNDTTSSNYFLKNAHVRLIKTKKIKLHVFSKIDNEVNVPPTRFLHDYQLFFY